MENCICGDKEICTYNLKDKNGFYLNDLVEEWKIAANDGKLICSECGQRVYLAAGLIKEPYFAHYDKQACSYGNQIESEELKKGKRLLYTLLKRSFPEYDIRARHKMGNGLYSTCYVINPNGQDIAVDYRLQNRSIDNFNERDKYYKENNIIPIYVLGINKNYDAKQISWYGNLIQKSIGLCIYLDTINEKIHLKKSFDFTLGNERVIQYLNREYSCDNLLIKSDGSFDCNFREECYKKQQTIQELKDTYYQNLQRVNGKDHKILVNGSIKNGSGIRPDILANALESIKGGEAHLVSKKYMDYILEHKLN